MAEATPKSYHTDPQLYLYTSLTSGSSQIVTATSRLQTILKANKIQFQALDVATDEKARMLWGRRAGKRKLPGLVRYGMIIGDLEQIEEWNEYGELKENVADAKPAPKATPSTSAAQTPTKAPPAPALPATDGSPSGIRPKALVDETKIRPLESVPSTEEPPKQDPQANLAAAMRNLGFEAAKQAEDKKAQARKDRIEAAKAKDAEMKKLDNSTAEGLPPPTGTTGAVEAQKPESGETTATSKADEAPAARSEDVETKQVEDNTAKYAKGKGPEEVLGAEASNETSVPTAGEVEKKANEAIADNEEEVLEGLGKVDPEKMEIPTAKEIEESANAAIVADKRSHVQIKGGGTVPSPLSPSLKKQDKSDNVPDSELEKDSKDEIKAGNTVSEVEKDDEEQTSETAKRQEAKVGVASSVTAGAPDAKVVESTPEQKGSTEGVIPLTNKEEAERKPSQPAQAASKSAPEPKADVLPLTDSMPNAKSDASHKADGKETPAISRTSPISKDDTIDTKVSAATAGVPSIPKTQEQPAAVGDKVGESVQD